MARETEMKEKRAREMTGIERRTFDFGTVHVAVDGVRCSCYAELRIKKERRMNALSALREIIMEVGMEIYSAYEIRRNKDDEHAFLAHPNGVRAGVQHH